jgi:rubrerythrin
MPGPLTSNQEKLLALFKTAIEEERKAQTLYREALHFCEEASLGGIIESFIGEEKKHEEILLKKYSELRNTDEFKDIA